ncbi:hotdog fold thioesterase [Gordonia sp. CPCC 206044]|uniref:hotdog fold thioesterase n=1 Tax=Gordonia sp. CPCC 206044 TaxID=3140793 RepID=UPI003AF4081C
MVVDTGRPDAGAPDDPVGAFGIGNVTLVAPGVVAADQQLGPRFADHRGRIDLPALAVLFDHLGGLPFFRSGPTGSPCVQARLSIATQGQVSVGDRVTGTAELLMHDDGFGTTRVDIVTSAGRLCCSGTARNVAVGRSFDVNPADIGGEGSAPGGPGAQAVALPPAIESHLTGREIVEQIAAGARSAGPLTELLNGRVEVVDHDNGTGVRFVVTTERWMGNVFGTMHGGVIGAIVAQACSFAGQANASAGRDYQLADLAAAFLRSPAVDGGDVVVEVVPVKVGRRIASFEAAMRADDGVLLCRAEADTHYR